VGCIYDDAIVITPPSSNAFDQASPHRIVLDKPFDDSRRVYPVFDDLPGLKAGWWSRSSLRPRLWVPIQSKVRLLRGLNVHEIGGHVSQTLWPGDGDPDFFPRARTKVEEIFHLRPLDTWHPSVI
jgi:hypothetical protein